MTHPPIENVDEYIAQFSTEVKNRLEVLRMLVKQEVPDAAESLSYGMIGYKLNGKPLIYFGGFKNHIGLYATPTGHEAFEKELSVYKQGKGSVQLPIKQQLPVELIKRVILHRKTILEMD
jgi:uncharacterized protein YdhG (YjbR/CyaY superfamily)